MSSEACVARERCAGRHEPEGSKWAECVIKGCGDHVQMLTCLFSVETVRSMRSGESGGKDNRLCTAPTSALLATTSDEWSHLGLWCANQRGDAERPANLGGTNNKVCCSSRLGIKGVVIGSLYRIDHECSPA